MRTLTIALSDQEYQRFGLTQDSLTFTEAVDLISKAWLRENLDASIIAASEGLSSLTLDDLTQEVQAVRNAKNNS